MLLAMDVKAPDLHLLFERVPGLYLVLTPDLTIVAVTDAYLNATMTTRSGMMGRFVFDVLPDNPNDPTAIGVRTLRASLDRVVQFGVTDSIAVQKYGIRRPAEKGGGFEERFWSAFNTPVLDPDGKLRYIIHRVEDNTDEYELRKRVAALFQDAALPLDLPDVRGFELDACYRPGPSESRVGGDWYDAMELSDGRIVVSVGDVGGSGLHAAVTMAALRQLIRGVAYVNPDPVTMLEGANRLLQTQYPDTYASAFVGVIDPVDMCMTFASAGHPAPLMRAADGTVEALFSSGILLGIPQHGTREAQQVALVPGAAIVMYTDGLVEWDRDPISAGARLREYLGSQTIRTHAAPATRIFDAVVGTSARDDVAVLTISVTAAAVATSSDWSCWEFDAEDAEAAHGARAEFVARLSSMGVNEDEIYAAALIFGELVGNVVRHGSGPVDVCVDWRPLAPVLHVRDRGPGFSYSPKLPGDPYSETGRGLFLISTLAEDFNVTRGPNGGTHARAIISLSKHRLLAL